MSPAKNICTAVVVSRIALRGMRSASAPPTGPRNAVGTNVAAATIPGHTACPVRLVT